jgi:hypothetical protein
VCLLKEGNVKPVLLFLTVSLILLSVSLNSVLAKCASLGIYAIVDQVTFEPNGSEPNCVRIAGVFIVPFRMSSGGYQKPRRGYLYLKVAPGAEQASRKDWNELKTIAGSGNVVAFGQYWVPNPEGESRPTPDIYPIPLPGVMKAEAIVHNPRIAETDCNADKIVEQLQEARRH